jgi:hypothetical protein
VARLGLADRARAASGASVTVGLGAAGTTSGRLVRSGPGWWLLEVGHGGDVLLPTAALQWVAGLPALATDPEQVDRVEQRLGLGYVLRGIARDRSPVTLVLRDAATLAGTIDRVGADFVDLAEHPVGEPRRFREVRSTVLVPLAGIAAVHRRL